MKKKPKPKRFVKAGEVVMEGKLISPAGSGIKDRILKLQNDKCNAGLMGDLDDARDYEKQIEKLDDLDDARDYEKQIEKLDDLDDARDYEKQIEKLEKVLSPHTKT